MNKNKKVVIIISLTVIIAIAIALAIIFVIKLNNLNKTKKEEKQLTTSHNIIALDNSYPSASVLSEIRKGIDPNIIDSFDLQKIINNNEQEKITEKIERKEADIEFTTQYRNNSSLASGRMQTIQEGEDGKQDEIVRSTYKNGMLVSTTPISAEVKKVAKDKIVEVGTGAYSINYVPIAGDKLRSIDNEMELKSDSKDDSQIIKKVPRTETVVIKNAKDDWYNVKSGDKTGWVKKDKVEYVNESANADGSMPVYTKEQLTQDVGISMLLNRRSGLTLEQFKQILGNDPNDKKDVFKNIYQYFYYVERQYNINGLFLASIAVHESGWGTSALSLRTKNLFGYGAYDRDPSAYANQFAAYESGIDLVARVLVKYYLNPKGTPIYNGEIAQGTYFHGSTVTGVNVSYASDKKWGEKVYKWMTYFYNKL